MFATAALRSVGKPKFALRRLTTVLKTGDALELVQTENIGRKAIAKVALQPGTVINVFEEPVESRPTMHTVQFDETTHVAPTLGAEFISHACADTNTRIVVDEDCRSASFVVTKPVEAGEDLFFNYNTTEWDMNSPFACACPACQAAGKTTNVQGFKYLTIEERTAIIKEVSPFVRSKSLQEVNEYKALLASLEDNTEYFAFDDESEDCEASA
ncbi:Hypothetical Protein FCC1311_111172 [Hondaea fermentalgiana]|uniref:SET domain-containing protein n=1 Tax=Hondaea fermentalgiana TaxID=2315210 RepID=A0A2R5H3A6_9STRA|nr:Hypothetical Protein FCC1311_111172 [Hondaea fermentalgiana]|eukprot:GBG34894.1 Hypothetical Protein FCC1311_111172 [Hondaea fermentalgiana]